MLLDGKVALVSGTGPNIGQCIAKTLADNGAKVACMDLSQANADKAVEQIQETGGTALGISADITDPDDVKKAVERVVSTYGSVDILVNNAGISDSKEVLDIDVNEWRKVIDVILTGTFLCSQAVARQMVAQGTGGSIVNVVSTSGHRGRRQAVAYPTAKGGLLNFTRTLAIQLAEHNIRVNSVTPTTTGASLRTGLPREEPPPHIPRGRWGRVEDQAEAVLFLASPKADFITGADLPVDGGVLAKAAG